MIGQVFANIGFLVCVVVLSAGVGALVALHVGCPEGRAAMHAPDRRRRGPDTLIGPCEEMEGGTRR